MENQIRLGDRVYLNSGGPEMTVQAVKENDATCYWFDGSKLKNANFKLSSLAVFRKSLDASVNLSAEIDVSHAN